MLASFPASMVNQKPTDLGIPNRFKLNSSRFSISNVAAVPKDLRTSTAFSSLSARSPISRLHAGCNPERHEPLFRAKQQHSQFLLAVKSSVGLPHLTPATTDSHQGAWR